MFNSAPNHSGMNDTRRKQGKVTAENLEEAARLKELWNRAKAEGRVTSQEAFGAAFDIGNQSAVGFFLNGRTALSLKAAVGFARGLECRVEQFSPRLAREIDGIVLTTTFDGSSEKAPSFVKEPTTKYAAAHPMSLLPHRVVSPIPWGASMGTTDLSPKFDSAAPDDSMAPRVRTGQIVTFDSTLQARTGDGVLVVDADGNPYLRIYKERRPGVWEAHAENPAYLPLESERDGLRVLAVVVGVQARWG